MDSKQHPKYAIQITDWRRAERARPSARSFGTLAPTPSSESCAISREPCSQASGAGAAHHIVGDGPFEPTFRRTQTFRHNAAACRRNVDCNAGSAGRGRPTLADLHWGHVQDSMQRDAQRDSSPTRRRQGIGPEVELSEDG